MVIFLSTFMFVCIPKIYVLIYFIVIFHTLTEKKTFIYNFFLHSLVGRVALSLEKLIASF